MIAGCPKCSARYRIDRDKLVDGAVRLRCTKCEAVFRVRAPEEPSEPSPPVEAPAAPVPDTGDAGDPTVLSARGRTAPRSDATPEAPAAPDGPRILLAVPDAELAKQTAENLRAGGYRPVVVHDGAQAMLETQRQMPSAVVLAADLPKMFGFQVCEVIKRNESLNHMHVVLVGAIHHPHRYRRPPEEIYGADSYLEAPDLADGLVAALARVGLGADGRPASGMPDARGAAAAPVAPPRADDISPEPLLEIDPPSEPPVPQRTEAPETPGPEAAAAQVPVAPTPPAAPAAQPQAAGLDEQRAKAERLARIIVSDIILYNEDKFAQAIAAGNVAEALGPDLAEGRGLFEDRVDPRVRGDDDYLMSELLRVARSRGME